MSNHRAVIPAIAFAASVLVLTSRDGSAQRGLQPAGTFAVAETTLDNYATVNGVVVDVKAYVPIGVGASPDAPVLFYGPGGGSGAAGSISQPGQFHELFRQLASGGLIVLHLQNELESAPGLNLWQVRGGVMMWALANHAGFNASFGTRIGSQSPVVVAGWSLGAASAIQHAGADLGSGIFTDARFRGVLLFASPALNAYGGAISPAALAGIDKPVLCVFGTDDLGQPGTWTPGQPPATSPRGQGVQAILAGPSPLLVAMCLQGASHFEYGSSAAAPGSYEDQRIQFINQQAFTFCDLLLRVQPGCAPFAASGWIDPAHVVWSTQRCAPAAVGFAGTGCATSAGVPGIGVAGGAPVAGNAEFAAVLSSAPAQVPFLTIVSIGSLPLPGGVSVPGAPACSLAHVVSGEFLVGVADGFGSAAIALPLPSSPSIWGLSIAMQHAVWDFAWSGFAGVALPFGTSPAMGVVVGSW